MLRDYVVALSLANLWFFNVWQLLLIDNSNYYHWKAKPVPILLATVLDVLLLALVLWLAMTLARRSQKTFVLRVARIAFVVMFFLLLIILVSAALNSRLPTIIQTLIKRPQLLFASPQMETLHLWLWVLGALAGWMLVTILIHKLVFRRQQLIKLVVALVLIASPFVLVTFGQAAWQCITYRSGEQFRETSVPAFPGAPNSGRRILWIIFDEFDFRLSFENRPPTVELPEFERLRSESIFAGNAYPPGGDTVLSLPALINGRLVARSNRTAPNELMLTFDNSQRLPWSTEPNIFSSARAMGLNTALAGWYHPYCRIIGSSLTRCSWEAVAFLGDEEILNVLTNPDVGLTKNMLYLGIGSFLPNVRAMFVQSENAKMWRKYCFQSYVNIHQKAVAMATDPNLSLIMIHYPIPHPPGIYDRSKHDFSFNSRSGYLDNLALSDRVLGELRREMEKAGLWETTIVLVSSDHGLRADRVWRAHPVWKPFFTIEDPSVTNSIADERVPFILRLPGESKGFGYTSAFNTVLSHDLLLALLSGQISKQKDVVKWLDEHRSIAQSPYVEEK